MYKINPITGKQDLVNPETPEFVPTEQNLRPPIASFPTATIYHNPSLPATAGRACMVQNFGLPGAMFGTFLDNTLDVNFLNFTEGVELMRRSGVGPSDITLDAQTITTQPAVRVLDQGDGTGLLVADLTAAGMSFDYFETADGDRFPISNRPAASIAYCPQLRAANAGSPQFTANFGANFTSPKGGTANKLNIYSKNGKLIFVGNGNSSQVLHIDSSHRLCHGGGADIIATSANLLDSLLPTGQVRIEFFVNENNPPESVIEHKFSFLPTTLVCDFDNGNFSLSAGYNPDADLEGVALYWYDGKLQANLPGGQNITLKAYTSLRGRQEVTQA